MCPIITGIPVFISLCVVIESGTLFLMLGDKNFINSRKWYIFFAAGWQFITSIDSQ